MTHYVKYKQVTGDITVDELINILYEMDGSNKVIIDGLGISARLVEIGLSESDTGKFSTVIEIGK